MIWYGIIIGWLLYCFLTSIGFILTRKNPKPIFLFLNGVVFPFVGILEGIKKKFEEDIHKEWWD